MNSAGIKYLDLKLCLTKPIFLLTIKLMLMHIKLLQYSMLNEKRNIVKVDERYWQDIVKYHSKSAGLVPLLEVEVLGITLYTSLQARTADASEIK